MSRSRRTALVIRGGWEGHRPVEATDLFLPFLDAHGFEVRVEAEDDLSAYADADLMAGTDLVLQCVTMSSITDEQVAGLRAAVRAGTGFAGWHGGVADSFRSSADYLQLVGGQFAAHPSKPTHQCTGDQAGQLPAAHDRVRPRRGPPDRRRIEDFRLETEQYWVLSDGGNDVLATRRTRPARPAVEPEVTCPAVWTRSGAPAGSSSRPRPLARRARAPDRPHDRRARTAVGEPLGVGIVGPAPSARSTWPRSTS
jgi:type 1 glutamine amidotransferase